MRIAALADVHGNLPALRAVLAEVDVLSVDAVVVAGDVVAGPCITESLELLSARPEPVHWVRGNGEREAVAAFDGALTSDDAPGRAASWSARALTPGKRDELASWPIAIVLDGVVFCHGSPRRDDEILTISTPDEVLGEVLSDVTAPLVVAGHTHRRFLRRGLGRAAFANAGSVGLPYEGRAGAFWMLVDDGVPALRETAYDHKAALRELRGSGFPNLEDHLDGSLLNPADPDRVAALFEHMAGRGQHPGPLR